MTLKFTLPDSYDFHARMYERIVHGNFSEVSRRVHKHRSQLSREYNPVEPQNSAVYETCLELEAWKEVQPEIFDMQAETLTGLIVSLRASGADGAVGDDAAIKMLCDELTTALVKRDAAQKRSAMVKLRATLDAYFAAERRNGDGAKAMHEIP